MHVLPVLHLMYESPPHPNPEALHLEGGGGGGLRTRQIFFDARGPSMGHCCRDSRRRRLDGYGGEDAMALKVCPTPGWGLIRFPDHHDTRRFFGPAPLLSETLLDEASDRPVALLDACTTFSRASCALRPVDAAVVVPLSTIADCVVGSFGVLDYGKRQ